MFHLTICEQLYACIKWFCEITATNCTNISTYVTLVPLVLFNIYNIYFCWAKKKWVWLDLSYMFIFYLIFHLIYLHPCFYRVNANNLYVKFCGPLLKLHLLMLQCKQLGLRAKSLLKIKGKWIEFMLFSNITFNSNLCSIRILKLLFILNYWIGSFDRMSPIAMVCLQPCDM